MASVSSVLRTCGLIVYLILNVCAVQNNASEPWITSIEVSEKSCVENNCKYLLIVHGGEFLGHLPWQLTPKKNIRGSSCDVLLPNYEIKEVETSQWVTRMQLFVPTTEGKIYFCLHYSEKKNAPFGGEWVHQGAEIFLELGNAAEVQKSNADSTDQVTTEWVDLSHDTDVNSLPNNMRPTQDEAKDIEVKVNDEYVNLNDLNTVRDMNGNDLNAQNDYDVKNNDSNDVTDQNANVLQINTNNKRKREVSDTNVESDENKQKGDRGLLKIDADPKYDDVNRKLEAIIENSNKVEAVVNEEKNTNQKPVNVDYELKKVVRPEFLTSMQPDIESVKEIIKPVSVKDNEKPMQDYSNFKILEVGDSKEPNNGETLDDFKKLLIKDFLLKELPIPYEESKAVDNTKSVQIDSGKKTLPVENHETEPTLYSKPVESIKLIDNSEISFSIDGYSRRTRQTIPDQFGVVRTVAPSVMIDGLRIEEAAKEPKLGEDGIPRVLADSYITLRLFGDGLTERTMIAFTYEDKDYGEPCKFLINGEYLVTKGSVTERSALFAVVAPPPESTGARLHICAKNVKASVTDVFKDEEKYMFQGNETYKIFETYTKILPLWAAIILVISCLMFSALFSGLNLGLMSLDRTELKIISNTGTDRERKYARAIMPVRDHGNYLLCSILLGNVAVNSTFTILLDDLTSGLFAVIFSTLAIVLLGEITPQAICSRHGLMIGARSICVTKAVMGLTAPLAFPVSKLLDYFLGEEIGSVYTRERLKELVKLTRDVNDLDKDEVNIISGALELRKKTVSAIMTKLEDVYMLPVSSVLDFETMSEIVKSGYSRIPVYEGQRGNIVTVLFIKDLAFVDPDDNTPLRTLCQYYQNPCNFVFEDVTLDVMFKQFKDGHKGHMAFVHRINNEGEGDPYYETIGLVTLEDVIEEMIQAEIVDETDVFLDNRTKRRRKTPQNKLQDFTAFAERHENQRIHISPQLTLATFQFLSTSVEAFRPDTVSETVLRRLLKQDVIHYIKLKGKAKKDPGTFVYHQGKPVDYFVLILEGRVEVTVGRENLVFEAGPFTYFGVQALTQNVGLAESPSPSNMGSLQNINMDAMLRHTFVPDYSVRAITELYYLTVKRSLYLAAKRATLMEKGVLSKGATNEQFDTEVDKLLQSVDEDISNSGDHKTPSRQVSPSPLPLTGSPRGRSFRSSPEPRNGDLFKQDEQEKLLKSP